MQPEERFLDDILSRRAVAEHNVGKPGKAQRVCLIQRGHFPAAHLRGLRGPHRARTRETDLRRVGGLGFHTSKDAHDGERLLLGSAGCAVRATGGSGQRRATMMPGVPP